MLLSCPGSRRPALLCPFILTSWPSSQKPGARAPTIPKEDRHPEKSQRQVLFCPWAAPFRAFIADGAVPGAGGALSQKDTLSRSRHTLLGWPLGASRPPVAPVRPPPRPGPTWGEEEGVQGTAVAASSLRGWVGGRGAGRCVPATLGPRRLRPGCQRLSRFWPSPNGSFTHRSPPRSPRPSSPPTAPLQSPCCLFRTARPPAAPSPCH